LTPGKKEKKGKEGWGDQFTCWGGECGLFGDPKMKEPTVGKMESGGGKPEVGNVKETRKKKGKDPFCVFWSPRRDKGARNGQKGDVFQGRGEEKPNQRRKVGSINLGRKWFPRVLKRKGKGPRRGVGT